MSFPLNAPLSDEELEQLAELINSRYEDGMGPPLELVDGLLSAAVVSPVMIPPSEYMPLIFDEDSVWETMEQAQQAMQLLMRFQNQIVHRITLPLDEDGELDEAHLPLLGMPEPDIEPEGDDPFAGIDDDFPFAAAWASGFLAGVNLREGAFRVLEGELDWLSDDLDMLHALTDFNDPDEDTTATAAHEAPAAGFAAPLTLRERFEKAMEIPYLLKALNDHRLAYGGSRTPVRAEKKPGRNDLCSCGSGRKYKRCCGAN